MVFVNMFMDRFNYIFVLHVQGCVNVHAQLYMYITCTCTFTCLCMFMFMCKSTCTRSCTCTGTCMCREHVDIVFYSELRGTNLKKIRLPRNYKNPLPRTPYLQDLQDSTKLNLDHN
jgi:hypothetical protein